MSRFHYFGIRHHGPGCARSLVRAFAALEPDCVLIEGPPEAESLIASTVAADMQPPVALLSYCPTDPKLAVYHPFAGFSPEWQTLCWAAARRVPVRFIDLPMAHWLALPEETAAAGIPETVSAATSEIPRHDPLDWLARASGYADGESWWNHMVEERSDGGELFAAIGEAMVTLRTELGDTAAEADPHQIRLEALREAAMRRRLREATRQGFERIAVVCGAWHLGGLQGSHKVGDDNALLKGLPKVKIRTTWVPWTYRHLTRASGYGAGIRAPGWYEHLWLQGRDTDPHGRTVGWLARVAQQLRERDLDCSSAHLIEAARLADTLAAMRERPAAGLDELNEATRSVLTMGDDVALRFIEDALLVGDRLGQVPADVPTVPLQRDLEQQQKSLRLKPEALRHTLDLDLRQDSGLARSYLLHRLNLLDIPWGEPVGTGRSARGTFHELWTLQWHPEFVVRLIEASRWGRTVEAAATARALARADQATDLGELSALVNTVLLADLAGAVPAVTRALDNHAAASSDALQLLDALPPLADVFRYGNVRRTDTTRVVRVLDSLIVRAAIALPLACCQIDDTAARALREKLLAADGAVALRAGEEPTTVWQRALLLIADSTTAHDLINGLTNRLLLDAQIRQAADAAQALSLHLSAGTEAARAAAWLDGFLNRNAMVLLHDPQLWQLVDDWLAGLGHEHFVRVLPLIRRTFGAFSASERRDLAERARQGGAPAPRVTSTPVWDETHAALPLPLLAQILGLSDD